MQWQPIETAPRDDTLVLVYRPREDADHPAHVGVDKWRVVSRCWYYSRRDQQPTHWMPLPDPPK